MKSDYVEVSNEGQIEIVIKGNGSSGKSGIADIIATALKENGYMNVETHGVSSSPYENGWRVPKRTSKIVIGENKHEPQSD